MEEDLCGAAGLEPGEAGLLLMGAIGLDDAARAALWLPLGAPELAASGVDPLAKAAEWGAHRCAAMLMLRGWDWRPARVGQASAMEAAASSGSSLCVEAMLSASDPSLDRGLWAKALGRALECGRPACARAILSRCGFEDFDPADSAEAMALAVESGSIESLELLLDAGWPPEMKVGRPDPAPELLADSLTIGKSLDMEAWGRAASSMPRLPGSISAIGLACLSERWDAARELVRRGADAKAPLRGGATPLMMCARGQSAQTVQELLGAGADPNARDSKGWTALMWAGAYAVSVGNEAVTRALLRAGADPSATGPGETGPLDIFSRRYGSHGDVAALCERVDPRPLLAKAAAETGSAAKRPFSATSIMAMEAAAKHWQAREDASKERSEIGAQCLAGRAVRGAGHRM